MHHWKQLLQYSDVLPKTTEKRAVARIVDEAAKWMMLVETMPSLSMEATLKPLHFFQHMFTAGPGSSNITHFILGSDMATIDTQYASHQLQLLNGTMQLNAQVNGGNDTLMGMLWRHSGFYSVLNCLGQRLGFFFFSDIFFVSLFKFFIHYFIYILHSVTPLWNHHSSWSI